MIVNVIGLGYIGLPTALMLAKSGIEIVGTDINEDIINKLNDGKMTFEENGLDAVFEDSIKKSILFSNQTIEADCYIISVPTPYLKGDKKIDPYFVIEAIRSILKICKRETIIIIESTISPGTIDKYIRPLISETMLKYNKVIHIAHAPERIIPGDMINELINNSRVVGVDSLEIGEKIKTIYSSFCKGNIVISDIRTAEMSKVVENTYRDINIAFANELAKICNIANMNVYEIIRIANMHPRVNVLQPGPGVGGHCISVDPWFLVGDYPGLANIILAARKINDSMPEYVLERISNIMDENNIDSLSKVGLYGLTYKEDVDDTRESPTLQLLDNMNRHLAKGIKVYDPFVKTTITENQYQNFDEFIKAVELVVIMVGHNHIKHNMQKLENKIVFDTRNIFDKEGFYKL